MDNQKNPATTIETLSHDGRGIAKLLDKKILISGALPGETVTFQILKKHRHYTEAKAINIESSAASRIEPACKHFDICGGCSLQHMSLPAQLQLKQETLLNQLEHFGGAIPQVILEPLHANEYGYRRKARLGAKFVIKKNKMLVGFREKASNYLADLDSCYVLHPHIGERLVDLKELMTNLSIRQQIPQIEVAMGDEAVALIFRHLIKMPEVDQNLLIDFGKKFNFHIYLQPNDKASVHKIWPLDNVLRLTYTLPSQNIEFLFHPLDFTQINLELNQHMVARALELMEVNDEDVLLDLYCGIGNFTLPLARKAKHVTGIEGSTEMVERAYENALHNKIANVNFYAYNLEKPLPASLWNEHEFNKILLDPPRTGAKELIENLPLSSVKRIVYVSCNPATLSRDVGLLTNKGFKLISAGIMNMFPQTSHVEAIAVLIK